MFLRSGMPFNYDTNAASVAAGLDTGSDSTVQQSQKEDADINVIVRRFGLTGELPQNPRPPIAGDFTGVTDFQSALNAVHAAERGFMEFPGEVRARFDNDPQKMMDFVADSKNRDEAIKLGLVKRPPETTRPADPVATPPAPPAA